jgi:hypothetical protein
MCVSRKYDTGVQDKFVLEINTDVNMIFSFKIGGLLNTTDPKAIGYHGNNRGYWGIIVRGGGAV